MLASWQPSLTWLPRAGPRSRPPTALRAATIEVEGKFEVAIIGGGFSGLLLALILGRTLRAPRRVRVFEEDWLQTGEKVTWKAQSSRERWGPRYVTLDKRFWSSTLPEELAEMVFHGGQPRWQEDVEHCAQPRNVDLAEVEARLLWAAQEYPFSEGIELIPQRYTQEDEEEFKPHAVVPADGSTALTALEEVFRGEKHEKRLAAVEVAYRTDVTVAEGAVAGKRATVVWNTATLADVAAQQQAQKRYGLVALSPAGGVLRLHLTEEEAKEVKDLRLATVMQAARPDGPLGPALQDGFRFFGMPADMLVPSTARAVLRSDVPSVAWMKLPKEEEEDDERALFVLGDAAGLQDLQPGAEKIGLASALQSLAKQLRAMQKCREQGWPLEDFLMSEHEESMQKIWSGQAGGFDPFDPEGEEEERLEPLDAVIAAVGRAHESLVKNLPPQQAEELPSFAATAEKIRESGLSQETCQLMDRMGSWRCRERQVTWQNNIFAANEQEEEEVVVDVKEVREALDASAMSPVQHFNAGVRLLKAGEAKRATESFRTASEMGHPQACYSLGVMMMQGKGTRKDLRAASKMFLLAVEIGRHAKAAYNLGLMYQHGLGVERDKVEAIRFMTVAAANGHRKAQKSEITPFLNGVGPWQDYEPEKIGVNEVMRYAKEGNSLAQYQLGRMHERGHFVKEDKAEASYWYMEAAKQGLSEAQFQLSCLLWEGDGVEQDYGYAMRMLETAARKGHPAAQHNLGVRYYQGDVVEEDREVAAQWFLRAAKKGVPESQCNIGWMMCTGDSIPQDVTQGVHWLEDAADRGNMQAIEHLEDWSGAQRR